MGNVFFPVCQVVKFNVKIYVCVPMSSLRFHLRFPYVSPKIRMFSKKKKKGLHFDFISDFTIFLPKSGCSLKKKGLHFDFISDFPIFLPKSGWSLKKKRSVNVFLKNIHDAACRIKSPRVPGVADPWNTVSRRFSCLSKFRTKTDNFYIKKEIWEKIWEREFLFIGSWRSIY